MDNNVILQDLRGMTVQIRHRESDAIVGTGVAISMDGAIITCAHVVRAAGVEPRDANSAEIGVYFPQVRGPETKARRAIVAACFPRHDDDIVLLQLVGGASPLAPEQIAILGCAEQSCGNAFRSYGYAPIGPYLARHADGKIMGAAEIVLPPGTDLHCEPIELRTRDVRPGMSGAAVLDVARNLVVGLVTQRWNPRGQSEDDNLAWATDAAVLTFDPFNFALRDDDLPLRAASQPKTDVAAARAQVAPDVGIAWNNAPSPLKEWVGRAELLAHLTADWRDPNRRVTGLIGFGGEGKSSLARKWVDGICRGEAFFDLLGKSKNASPLPDGVFWWGFYERPSVDEFFEAALKFMSGGKIDPRKVPSANVRAQIIGAMLGAGRYLFVLDGLEVMQHQEGDQYGLLKSGDLKEFIGYFAAGGHSSFLLITSRAPLLDLMGYTTYTQRDVERLSPADGRALLREIGVRGNDAALDQVVADWDGHALALSLLAAYLVERHAGQVAHVGEIPIPTANEERYARVHRVLRRYDEHLSDAERAFLMIFSAFRTEEMGYYWGKMDAEEVLGVIREA